MNIDLFVGREQEVKRIVSEANLGRSSLIISDAGMGKTALMEVCSLILKDDFLVIELSRLAPFSTFLREIAEQLHDFELIDEEPTKLLKQLGDNAARAKHLIKLISDYDGTIVCVIDDVSGITVTNRPWLEELADQCVVITSATPELLGKTGTKRFWKRFEEVRLEALNREESQELFNILVERYNIKTDEPEIYKRKILAAAQGSPYELNTMIKSHSPYSIVKSSTLSSLNESRVDTDQKGVAIVPWILLLSPLAMVARYTSRIQGDLDGYILSAFGMAFMFICVYFLRGSLKPKSG